MIGILNYGLGNTLAFFNVFKRRGIQATIISDPNEVKNATKLILPGVGAFDNAMNSLRASNLLNPVEEAVLEYKIPILGVCVGMQMLASSSEEGVEKGLGWIPGVVKKLTLPDLAGSKFRLPHMGWNSVSPTHDNPLILENQPRDFYFLHSYYFQCENEENNIATTEYGSEFCAMVRRNNIFGAQFHPEKSHIAGELILKNFATL